MTRYELDGAAPGDPLTSGVTRRQVLVGGLGIAATAAAPFVGGTTARAAQNPRLWSSKAGWGGRWPTNRDIVHIRDTVVLDRNVTVGALVVHRSGTLIFAPGRSIRLASRGNVVVRGTLQMSPRSRRQVHRMTFDGIDESSVVGGMGLRKSDVGLWVRDRGRLVFDGCPKTPWVRAAGDLNSGARLLRLRTAPQGWYPGDELVIAPTRLPDGVATHDEYDTVRVVKVRGDTVTVFPPLSFDHPAHQINAATMASAEVMNLTRNVQVEGRPGARAHVHVTASVPQDMRHFSLRYMGPRKTAGAYTETILGRYGLHFDMAGNASRGTLVAGAVVRDTGSHAYVPHGSHGITFRGCISHNTIDDAYWWDGAADTRTPQRSTHDLTYDSCIASKVRCDPPFRGFRLTGFNLGAGKRNVAKHCTAVGVLGNNGASGFLWPEGGVGAWSTTDCVAHNNAVSGIFAWQNSDRKELVSRFLSYGNGDAGIDQGAYLSAFRYADCVLYGNRVTGLRLQALSSKARGLAYDNIEIDGAGIGSVAVQVVDHTLKASGSTEFTRCTFRGYRSAAIMMAATSGPRDRMDFVRCASASDPFSVDPAWVGGRVRWSDATWGTFRLTDPTAEPTTSTAAREEIPAFVNRPIGLPTTVDLTPRRAGPFARATRLRS